MSEASQETITAIQRGDLAAVGSLLAGSSRCAQLRDANGVSVLMWACYLRQGAIAAAIATLQPALDLFEAVAMGDGARAEALLSTDPGEARAWSADGFTALHFAACFARPGLAAKLLESGSDAAAVSRNPMQVTPLHSAVAARCRESCRLLLEHGAPPDARQQHGWTALMAAAMHGDEALVELLLAHGASSAMTADDGRDAIGLALEQGHPALAARLRSAVS